jgi:hypothetical protein
MICSISVPRGGFTTLNLPQEAVAYGWLQSNLATLSPDDTEHLEADADLKEFKESSRRAGGVAHGLDPQGQLIVVLQKKGENAASAIQRVSAAHPQTSFVRLDVDLVFRGGDFGVEDPNPGEVVLDFYETNKGIAFDCDADSELLLSRLIREIS